MLFAGIGSGPIFVYQSHCSGSESSFDKCNLAMYPGSGARCNHFDDVTLRCIGKLCLQFASQESAIFSCLEPCTHGEVELFGSPVTRVGIVLVCINGTWGKVCNGDRDNYFASIVCSQLGFSPYGIDTNNLILVTSTSVYFTGANAAKGIWSDRAYIYHMHQPICPRNATSILGCNYSEIVTISGCNNRHNRYDATSVACLNGTFSIYYNYNIYGLANFCTYAL